MQSDMNRARKTVAPPHYTPTSLQRWWEGQSMDMEHFLYCPFFFNMFTEFTDFFSPFLIF